MCNRYSSPLIKDCKSALEYLKNALPEGPRVCEDVIRPVANIAVVGTCTVQTTSQKGRAHCLDGKDIKGGIQDILNSCKVGDMYTGGISTWTVGSPWKDIASVKLI